MPNVSDFKLNTQTGQVDVEYSNGTNVTKDLSQALTGVYNTTTGQTVLDETSFGLVNPDEIALSRFLSDQSGSTDQRANFISAMDSAIASGKWLVVDVPCFIDIQADWTKPVFLKSGLKLKCRGAGRLTVNQSFVPAFMIVHQSNIKLYDLEVQYIGQMPAVFPGWMASDNFNTITLQNWLIANCGLAISSRTPLNGESGTAGIAPIFKILGETTDVEVLRPHIYVSEGVLPSRYIPTIFTFGVEWKKNSVIGSLTPRDKTYVAQPARIRLSKPVLDGAYHFIHGSLTDSDFDDVQAYRYADLQDDAGGNLGGSAEWFAGGHCFYLTGPVSGEAATYFYPDRVNIRRVRDYGIKVGSMTTIRNANSLKITKSGIVTVDDYESHRPGGFGEINNNDGVSIRRLRGTYDSSQSTFGFRIQTYQKNLVLDDWDLSDVNLAPAYIPIAGYNYDPSSKNLSITNIRMRLPDFTGTAHPSFHVSADGVKIDLTLYLASHTATQQYRGVMLYDSGSRAINTDYTATVYGWRASASNFDALKPRIILNNASSSSVIGRFVDKSNSYEAEVRGGFKREYRTIHADVQMAPGSTVATGLTIPANWSVAEAATYVKTALGTTGGVTSYQIGVSGTPLLLGTSDGVAFGKQSMAENISSTGADRAVILTAVGGTFDAAGNVRLTIRLGKTSASE